MGRVGDLSIVVVALDGHAVAVFWQKRLDSISTAAVSGKTAGCDKRFWFPHEPLLC